MKIGGPYARLAFLNASTVSRETEWIIDMFFFVFRIFVILIGRIFDIGILINYFLERIWIVSCKNLFFNFEIINRIFRLQCFKSAWLYAFLHDGLKFPVNYERLRSASLVNNNDVQWTLGAILYKTRFLPLRFRNFLFLIHKKTTTTNSSLLEQSIK